jgi:tetratricopeptide (TPR) repeat protein
MHGRWLLFALALAGLACGGGATEAAQSSPPSTRPVAEARTTPQPESPTAGDLPVTTSSPAALDAFRRGRDFFENSRPQDAVPELRRAVELDPGFAHAHAYLGKCIPGPEGEQHLEKAVAMSSNLPEVERLWIEHSQTVHEGDIVASREQLGRLAALLPGDTRILFAIGYQSLQEGNWEEAAVHFRNASRHNPKPAVWNALGHSLARQGNLDEALVALRRFVEAAPAEPGPYHSLGEAQLMSRDLDSAEASFRKAIEIAPSFSRAWQGLAQIWFLRGQWREGHEALTRFRRLSRRPPERVASAAHAAIATLAQGRLQGALRALKVLEERSLAEKWPAGAVVAADLQGIALADAGKHAGALRQFTRALGHLDRPGVPAMDRAAMLRSIMLHQAVSQSALRRSDEVRSTLARLESEWQRAPRDRRARSAVHAVRGLLASSKSDHPAAVAELQRADRDDPFVAWRLIEAQERAGDGRSARQTRARILAVPRLDILYLLVHSRVDRQESARND